MDSFRRRQVHLDFHTSPLIPGIGSNFSKEEWQAALKAGHVNSITVFSKCHHGWAYHPTGANEMHPNLSFDLLGAELEACKEIGVRAPVYISAGLDEKEAVRHHEWLNRNYDNYDKPADFSRPGYHLLCFNTPYLDKLLAQIDEVMVRYNPCEIFLDIVGERTCVCEYCRKDMEEQGIDWRNEAEAFAFGQKVYRHYLDEVERVVHARNPETTIFQNSGHLTKGRRDLIDTIEEPELESLPTGGWGYDHFPLSAAYARTVRKNFLGMTGKFHKSWGEFGGFKHPNALRYEAALSLACGAGCSIGDQMHPDGRLNMSTFNLIGKAYAEVEAKEPWCDGAKFVPDIAVLSAESIYGSRANGMGDADIGANRILLETHRLYDFVDADADFSPYRLMILPDYIPVDAVLKAKLDAFLASGGKLLLSGESGLGEDGKFVFNTGAEYCGKNEFNPNYLVPCYDCVNGITPYIMRANSYLIKNEGAEVVAKGKNPYFNRTAEHFCSHQHAPDAPGEYPAAVINGSIAYIGWDIFRGYALYGDFHIKELVNHIVCRLMDNDFTLDVSLPDKGVATLFEQNGRKILHLLYAHTTLRGKDTEVIEDIVPIYNISVSVKMSEPSKVVIVPEGKEIPFEYNGGRVSFTVPELNLHTMVSIEY